MPYLSVAEYIARFGARETTIITSDTPGGQYDSAKVDSAIGDAQEVVEGYVGARYATPIADPPRIVKGWTAALARYALYVGANKVSDAVKDAAELARSQLRDVQAGRMNLPVAEGAVPPAETNTLGTASSSMDRDAPLFGGGGLDGFTAPILGGSLPCWRSGT